MTFLGVYDIVDILMVNKILTVYFFIHLPEVTEYSPSCGGLAASFQGLHRLSKSLYQLGLLKEATMHKIL